MARMCSRCREVERFEIKTKQAFACVSDAMLEASQEKEQLLQEKKKEIGKNHLRK